jgi:hypothetical protein
LLEQQVYRPAENSGVSRFKVIDDKIQNALAEIADILEDAEKKKLCQV